MRSRLLAVVVMACAVALAGCSGSTTGGGDAGSGGHDAGGHDAAACTVPAAGQIDGEYLFAWSAVTAGNTANTNRPFVFLNTVTTQDVGGNLVMDWNLQPLLAEDRKTPSGSPLSAPNIGIAADGSFDATPGPLEVEWEANALSGSPITADLTSVAGRVCDLAGFYCGHLAADLIKPLSMSFAGSTWTMQKIDGGVYPEPPKFDCALNSALPLPLPPL